MVYKKQLTVNKIKLFVERFLTDVFCIIGMIAVLGWSIGLFSEAWGYWFDSREVSIVNQHNVAVAKADAPVVDGDEGTGDSQAVPSLADIADKIYQLESSGGKYVNCPQGKFNGYGFAQNKFEWACYDNPEEPRELVMNWFEENLKQHTLKESLCFYNQGIITEDCHYSEKFLNI